MHPLASNNPAVQQVVVAPISRARVVRIALVGFGMVVSLVLLAAYLGYRGSDRIQETAQSLVREGLVQSDRAASLEARIEEESKELLDSLAWVLGLCIALAAGTALLTIWIMQRAFARLEWQSHELAQVSWHLIDGHEKMARRFSHEMHDELGQSLSGLRRMLSRVETGRFDTIRQDCLEIVDEVLQNVRKLSQVLRPVILDDFGLDSGLRWLCERSTQRTGIPVHYTSNTKDRFTEGIETHLFRITQEALTNIARHSEAKEAWVDLQVSGNRIRLSIQDNGKGLQDRQQNAPPSPSLGMVGMRARARHLNGELVVENRKEGGLSIRVETPLQQEEQISRNELRTEPEDSSVVG